MIQEYRNSCGKNLAADDTSLAVLSGRVSLYRPSEMFQKRVVRSFFSIEF